MFDNIETFDKFHIQVHHTHNAVGGKSNDSTRALGRREKNAPWFSTGTNPERIHNNEPTTKIAGAFSVYL